jgi:hypothetical protein
MHLSFKAASDCEVRVNIYMRSSLLGKVCL